VQWQISERFAVRGDAGFSWSHIEQTSLILSVNGVTVYGPTTESNHRTTSVGLSGLITVSKREQLRLYVAPRVAWNTIHTSFETEVSAPVIPGVPVLPPPFPRSTSSTSNGFGFVGMFGANYRLSDRFAIFGEAGISFARPTATSSSLSTTLKSFAIHASSDVGIVIFF
jgi:hypothetical protein